MEIVNSWKDWFLGLGEIFWTFICRHILASGMKTKDNNAVFRSKKSICL